MGWWMEEKNVRARSSGIGIIVYKYVIVCQKILELSLAMNNRNPISKSDRAALSLCDHFVTADQVQKLAYSTRFPPRNTFPGVTD